MISSNQKRGPRRAADAAVTLADISLTTATLDWRPRVTFAQGLDELKRGVARAAA
jgi:nucleoside-diphosphate-sugar epimerase